MTTPEENREKLQLFIPSDLKRRLAIKAATERLTMTDIVIKAIEQHLTHEHA